MFGTTTWSNGDIITWTSELVLGVAVNPTSRPQRGTSSASSSVNGAKMSRVLTMWADAPVSRSTMSNMKVCGPGVANVWAPTHSSDVALSSKVTWQRILGTEAKLSACLLYTSP